MNQFELSQISRWHYVSRFMRVLTMLVLGWSGWDWSEDEMVAGVGVSEPETEREHGCRSRRIVLRVGMNTFTISCPLPPHIKLTLSFTNNKLITCWHFSERGTIRGYLWCYCHELWYYLQSKCTYVSAKILIWINQQPTIICLFRDLNPISRRGVFQASL